MRWVSSSWSAFSRGDTLTSSHLQDTRYLGEAVEYAAALRSHRDALKLSSGDILERLELGALVHVEDSSRTVGRLSDTVVTLQACEMTP